MRSRLTSLLKTAQLKDEEIKIYLLLLKYKNATAYKLIQKTDLPLASVYRNLKRLQEKGLIEAESINNKQKIYKPLSFKKLIRDIKAEKRKLSQLERKLKGLDPFISYMELNEDKEEDIIVRDGVEAMREEYLKIPDLCKDECLPLGNVTNMLGITGFTIDCPEERNFIQRRFRKGVYVRMLNKRDEITEELQTRDTMEKRTLKLKERLPMMENFLVITEKQSTLFLCDREDPKVVLIKNSDLLELQRHQFEYLWKKYS